MAPPLVRLEDVAIETQYGTAEKANEGGRGLPVLRMGNITEEGRFDLSNLKHVVLREPDIEKYTVRRGDILFNRTNSPSLVGKTAVWSMDETYAFAGYLIRLRLNPKRCVPAFVSHMLNTPRMKRELRNRAKPSINMSNLSASELLKFEVPLPGLTEQRRIAGILDRAEALRSKRRGALALLDSLTQSIFLELFGDPGRNTKKWRTRLVSEYVAQFQGGRSMESLADTGLTTKNRVLKISAVTSMRFDATQSKPVPDDYIPPTSHFVRPGDLLFSRANTEELVGAVALVGEEIPDNLLLPDKLWRFIWTDPGETDPRFIWHLFQTEALRAEIGRRASGTSGSMKNISQEKLFGIRTIFPEISVQRAFGLRAAMIERLYAKQSTAVGQLDELFASLQHRAFNGTL